MEKVNGSPVVCVTCQCPSHFSVAFMSLSPNHGRIPSSSKHERDNDNDSKERLDYISLFTMNTRVRFTSLRLHVEFDKTKKTNVIVIG